MVNGNKSNPELMAAIMDSSISERAVNMYFESSSAAVCELATLFNQALIRAKVLLASKNPFMVTKLSTEEKKIDPLLKEISQLKKMQENYKTQNENILKDNTILKSREKELTKELEMLKGELKSQADILSELLPKDKELELLNALNNLQVQVNEKNESLIKAKEELKSKKSEISTLNSLIFAKDEEIERLKAKEPIILNNIKEPTKAKPALLSESVARLTYEGKKTPVRNVEELEAEIRTYYENACKKEIDSLSERLNSASKKVIVALHRIDRSEGRGIGGVPKEVR
eukprot:TRINITY_DN15255_c0_g2_i3.p1 TRINITY_DN15255_c0_g2~~TRINITY_DN15255_c0_g2_i3.p1  ORF type:complete len:287 (-),score=43.84 TRINITY_DN15255_c0_g2_i3:420-1280(-)